MRPWKVVIQPFSIMFTSTDAKFHELFVITTMWEFPDSIDAHNYTYAVSLRSEVLNWFMQNEIKFTVDQRSFDDTGYTILGLFNEQARMLFKLRWNC